MAGKRVTPKQDEQPRQIVSWLVYSTLSNGTEIVDWDVNPINNIPARKYSVVIKGGANVVNRKGLITPLGVMTEITQEQMDFLNSQPMFLQHVKDGWMTCVKAGGWRDDPDIVAANMASRDGCSPDKPEDYEASKQGKIGKINSPAIIQRHANRKPFNSAYDRSGFR